MPTYLTMNGNAALKLADAKPNQNAGRWATRKPPAPMPINSATRFLNERIKAGLLKRRKGLINGKSGWLYSAVNKD